MRPFRYFWLSLSLLLLVTACGEPDLSLINEVKRFETEWMDLSEKVTFIDRNLRLAEIRYTKDQEAVGSRFSVNRQNSLSGLASRYQQMKADRSQIQQDFEAFHDRFSNILQDFNEWENRLLQDKVEGTQARVDFQNYTRQYRELNQEAGKLEARLYQNIEEHNAIMRRVSAALNLFTNFDINPQ